MGLAINRDTFSDQEYQEFARRIRRDLAVLESMLATRGFGCGSSSFGAELEVYLVDRQGHTAWVAEPVLADSREDARLTHELNRYNLEYNLSPVEARGRPFSILGEEMMGALATLTQTAAVYDAEPVPIGILPTLAERDFESGAITDQPRYHALSKGLLRLRGEPFAIDIDGPEPLAFSCSDVAVEGANTSFQIHWRVNPEQFVSAFNAVQLVTPLLLSVACNSPSLLGHLLWHETRVAVFKQSIDYRHEEEKWRVPTRVPFGFGWLATSPMELFRQSVALYPPLLPVLGEEDSAAVWRDGGIPRLDELRLHQGAIWPWNRGIYDSADGGHLRIEMRALPAGPTVVDMMANMALFIGLANDLRGSLDELLAALPFQYVERNFYRAARHGLAATLLWPGDDYSGPRERSAGEIIRELLPRAEAGLAALGVTDCEITRQLSVIDERLRSRQTGSSWQLAMVEGYEKQGLSRSEALSAMFDAYRKASRSGQAVSHWSTSL
ncbi:MAG TPA: glutamate--cysteine ligase [Porticoccaceae bacterium]|nr:glutamate--cysteine ligase [Porticoccaceae bacterium]HCO59488.1 glutamate--cysteine ligase [Porticoccaceae bacterium]